MESMEAAAPPVGPYLPWEDPSQGNFLKRLVKTVGLVLFRPNRAFRRPAKPDLWLPMSYAMFLAIGLGVAELLCSSASGDRFHDLSGIMVPFELLYLLMDLVAKTLWVGSGIFFLALLAHLMVKLVTKAKATLNSTLRVVCYTASPILALVVSDLALITLWKVQGTGGSWRVVLIVSVLVFMVIVAPWSLVLLNIGVARTYAISLKRAFWAVLPGLGIYLLFIAGIVGWFLMVSGPKS